MDAHPSPALEDALAPGVRYAHIEPLHTRIERNRRRFLAFMVVFTTSVSVAAAFAAGLVLFVVVAVVAVRDTSGAASAGQEFVRTLGLVVGGAFVLSLALSWAWALVRLSQAEHRLVERLGARMPRAGTHQATRSALRDMAIAAGLPAAPQLYVIDTDSVNAFVVGRDYEKARIGVTRGLLERIPVDEQRAVFANLVSRVLSLDTLWATAVSALMGPVWAMRDYDFSVDDSRVSASRYGSAAREGGEEARPSDPRTGCLPVYGVAVLITEFLSWYHREGAWRAAEKADAEGMMLLKDPTAMLGAIEHVLESNNHVQSAGDAYSQLFYCWAGFGFAPEDDPEMRRVARLREALGAEGAPFVPRPNVRGWSGRPVAPVAPRLEGAMPSGEE